MDVEGHKGDANLRASPLGWSQIYDEKGVNNLESEPARLRWSRDNAESIRE
jgi:hypothetical protein